MAEPRSEIDFEEASTAFSRIYEKNIWGNGSGASAPAQTSPYMNFITEFMKKKQIKSVVDVGCGDWQFSRTIDWRGISYHGFDVVDSVIRNNQLSFGANNVKFSKISSLEGLPPADLVLCKDVLQHLPNRDVITYLEQFRRAYRFALITNDRSALNKTPEGVSEVGPEWVNRDIEYGQWRLLDLNAKPFNLGGRVVVRWSIDAPTMSWTKEALLYEKKWFRFGSRWLFP